jgi:hypothetical protein
MGRFLEIALEILFLYFLYRLVFDFIIPIYRSSKKVHSHLKEMQERMQDQLRKDRQQRPQAPPQKEGEYIDYEEVSDKP